MMNILKLFKEKITQSLKDSYNPDIGNLTIIGKQVFIDGRELESQKTSNIHLTQKNGKVLVNGKMPIYKDEPN